MDSSSSSKFPTSPPSKYPIPTPPPSSIPKSFLYDVFLSFRGIDTRNNFTSHLYDRLVEAGIRTFKDDDELHIGQEISIQLMRAIEESRIYIVVFSQNYASSRWCLDELVKIIHQIEYSSGQVLIPVFYGIQPSDVRWQKGSFEQAFRRHKTEYINQPDLVKSWRHALIRSSGYSGFDLESSALGSESRLITLIVKEVLSLVNPKKLFVAKYPVGLDSRVNHVHSLLSLEPDYHVQLIGIFGMGGSGKTVTAKALYNKILQSFDATCFLANVREDSQQPNGLLHLQEYLISELMMQKNVKVGSVDRGIEIIRERLCLKKVLIVLDDLDKASQIDVLAGHRDWFGPGSVIIITTRDQQLLNQVQVDGTYEPKELNSEESLELFSLHAFKTESPQESYAAIAIKIVAYSQGLPLALVVLGSYLGGRRIRPVREWNSAFESLQKFPPDEIQKILKISYDGLDNDEQREIFLDISCFFIGTDIDYVTEVLNGCDFSTEIGIGILKDRCLLTIDISNKLRMHDLLRDMGREIIRKQCPQEPGKRSRLWSHQDATNVVMRNRGTEAIEGVTLVSPIEEEIHLNTKNFVRMQNLRLLKMNNVNLDGSFDHLSEKIRWISWKGCSLKHLPFNWEMQNVVVLDMQQSKMKTVRQDDKFFGHSMYRAWQSILFQRHLKIQVILRHLKILNLSHSKLLTSTPDFKSVPRLVTLILEGCTSLLKIHPSIACLDSLLVLNLKGCENISYFPSEHCRLTSLGYLNLSGCSNLKELPRDLGCIELRELYADETAITHLPYFFCDLIHLTSLSLRGCTNMSGNANNLKRLSQRSGNAKELIGFMPRFVNFRSLRRLNLRECNLSDEDIPINIGKLSGLQELELAGNSLSKLPDSFKELTNLQSLSLDNWSILPPELGHLKPTIDNVELPE